MRVPPVEEAEQARKHVAVDDELCLVVVARHDVTYRPQGGGLDLGTRDD